jgi:hypothetical protein
MASIFAIRRDKDELNDKRHGAFWKAMDNVGKAQDLYDRISGCMTAPEADRAKNAVLAMKIRNMSKAYHYGRKLNASAALDDVPKLINRARDEIKRSLVTVH